jgi:hypothetical protein
MALDEVEIHFIQIVWIIVFLFLIVYIACLKLFICVEFFQDYLKFTTKK